MILCHQIAIFLFTIFFSLESLIHTHVINVAMVTNTTMVTLLETGHAHWFVNFLVVMMFIEKRITGNGAPEIQGHYFVVNGNQQHEYS